MTNLVIRNCERSLAKSILSVEKELGIILDSTDAVEYLNQRYNYVAEGDIETLETLKKQVVLDIAAERHATDHPIPSSKLSEIAVALTALDRKLGILPGHFNNDGPVPSTDTVSC